MHAIVESRRAEIEELCRRHHVKRLDVFGSAANGTFNSETSDIDFLVEFDVERYTKAFDSYFDLLFSLEALFQRPIDLVTASAMRNKYFIQGVNESREIVYGG